MISNDSETDKLYKFFVTFDSNDVIEYNTQLDTIRNKLLSWDVDLTNLEHTLSVQFLTLEIFIKQDDSVRNGRDLFFLGHSNSDYIKVIAYNLLMNIYGVLDFEYHCIGKVVEFVNLLKLLQTDTESAFTIFL